MIGEVQGKNASVGGSAAGGPTKPGFAPTALGGFASGAQNVLAALLPTLQSVAAGVATGLTGDPSFVQGFNAQLRSQGEMRMADERERRANAREMALLAAQQGNTAMFDVGNKNLARAAQQASGLNPQEWTGLATIAQNMRRRMGQEEQATALQLQGARGALEAQQREDAVRAEAIRAITGGGPAFAPVSPAAGPGPRLRPARAVVQPLSRTEALGVVAPGAVQAREAEAQTGLARRGERRRREEAQASARREQGMLSLAQARETREWSQGEQAQRTEQVRMTLAGAEMFKGFGLDVQDAMRAATSVMLGRELPNDLQVRLPGVSPADLRGNVERYIQLDQSQRALASMAEELADTRPRELHAATATYNVAVAETLQLSRAAGMPEAAARERAKDLMRVPMSDGTVVSLRTAIARPGEVAEEVSLSRIMGAAGLSEDEIRDVLGMGEGAGEETETERRLEEQREGQRRLSQQMRARGFSERGGYE